MDISTLRLIQLIQEANKLINSKVRGSDEDIKLVLDKITDIIVNSNYECKASTKTRCAKCGAVDLKDWVKLECGHKMCGYECLKLNVEDFTSNYQYHYSGVLCPKETCFREINVNILIKAYVSKDEFYRRFEPKIECNICYSEHSVSEFVTLDCDHRFCEGCFRSFFLNLILEGKISRDNFACPNCQTEIDTQILLSRSTPEEKEKLEQFFIRT